MLALNVSRKVSWRAYGSIELTSPEFAHRKVLASATDAKDRPAQASAASTNECRKLKVIFIPLKVPNARAAQVAELLRIFVAELCARAWRRHVAPAVSSRQFNNKNNPPSEFFQAARGWTGPARARYRGLTNSPIRDDRAGKGAAMND